MTGDPGPLMIATLAVGLFMVPCPPAAADGPAAGGHGHHGETHGEVREAPTDMAVRLVARADAGGGFNLNIQPAGFRFSPENTGQITEAAEGHAHLYVNGQKKARVYGPWFHLPPAWLRSGRNQIRITLNDNRHRDWSRDGVVIAATVVVEHGEFSGIEFAHALGGPVRTFKVPQGAQVRLTLTAQDQVELHLHGYDVIASAAPDTPAIIAFHAEHAGRFALVVHMNDDLLGRDETAVAYFEVEPE